MAESEEDKEKYYEMPPDLEVSPEVEHKLTVWSALECIEDGTFTPQEAMDAYHVTAEDLTKYKASWDEMKDKDE